MKFELSLKSTHQDIIQELKNKLSLESDQDIVKKAVESALQMKMNDLIFATEREKCVGGCFGATPCFADCLGFAVIILKIISCENGFQFLVVILF